MGNICVIGPRKSGKTTYLAALAYLSEKDNQNYQITGITNDAKKLGDQAQTIILQGANMQPTEIDGVKIKSVFDLPLYSFKLEIKRRWLPKKEDIDLVFRDYPGEIFDELASGIYKPVHQEFIDECFVKDVVGCLLLLHRWDRGGDRFYSQLMNRFIDLMDDRDRSLDLRLAVAMSKCERGELWPGRLDPEIDIFKVHLPRTTSILRNKMPPQNLRFYAISPFGVLKRNDPRPNRLDELGSEHSVLRQTSEWAPYGMISPLYWLSKGKRM
ncbi:MAG: hypothetical protein GDA43_22010 [Hormoscilla sp. SP5CHS1]|nr:hypothetical protein [Hormoscilla sp. SP12CHS1]MBC6455532.1 hypothetical protein [Hormoscilla sp. SP5CHS1]